jgi:two-component sensor histidine kinase
VRAAVANAPFSRDFEKERPIFPFAVSDSAQIRADSPAYTAVRSVFVTGGGAMSIVSLFPDSSKLQNVDRDAFEREVAARFGLVPNFFRSAPDAPHVIREMWAFAKSAYLDSPIPTLFKERLFVYLSRFCEARYCITRHCGFLLGLGRSAGDPNAQAMTIGQVIRLLQRPIPTAQSTDGALARLEALAEPVDWPSPETSYDDDLLTAATVLFLQPATAGRAKQALRIALGGEKFELLIGFLTFIRSAHYWTLMHPELALEDDVKELLREHEALARMLREDTEAGRCEMGTRLFEELQSLRDLNSRQELEAAKRKLEEVGLRKDLLLKEVDHRVKNSLQIVSGLLHLQASAAGAAASQFHNAAARVTAIAAIHEQLHKYDYVGTLALDQYLVDLCRGIAEASSSPDRAWTLTVDADPLTITTAIAMPLGLVVNELVTNAIQHSRPAGEGGSVHIMLKDNGNNFSIAVSDQGDGPVSAQTGKAGARHSGLGTRIVATLCRQIEGVVTRDRSASGYAVTVTVPQHDADLQAAGAITGIAQHSVADRPAPH